MERSANRILATVLATTLLAAGAARADGREWQVERGGTPQAQGQPQSQPPRRDDRPAERGPRSDDRRGGGDVGRVAPEPRRDDRGGGNDRRGDDRRWQNDGRDDHRYDRDDRRYGRDDHRYDRDDRRYDRDDRRYDRDDRWRDPRWYGGRPRWDVGRYYPPPGYYYRRWERGARLPPAYYAPRYVVVDPYRYGLRPPPYGCHWVRVGGDVILAAIATGVVLDVVYDWF
jgi:Ni/Co efflux regulator RcnB